MSFSDDDLKWLKERLSSYGIDPGIDVCNYFDNPYEIADLVYRLEAAEKLIEACGQDINVSKQYKAWRKAKGEKI